MEYLDPDEAMKNIPVLNMLFQPVESLRIRARKLAAGLRKQGSPGAISVIKDISKAGGGPLPDAAFDTYAVSIVPLNIAVNDLERRLRSGSRPVIARIREDALLLDARTVRNNEIPLLVEIVSRALS